MHRSMTGYGRGSAENEGHRLQLQLKSVNNRYLDIQVRGSRALSAFEPLIRKRVAALVKRGKLEIYLTLELKDGKGALRLDLPLAEAYVEAYQGLAQLADSPVSKEGLLAYLARQGDLVQSKDPSSEEAGMEALIEAALQEALTSYLAMCEEEGALLVQDIRACLAEIDTSLEEIAQQAAGFPERFRERLLERVAALFDEKGDEFYNGQRVAAEIAIYTDKADIREELTRMKSHLKQFEGILAAGGAMGKKLDFLVQEMLRETNTMASKASELELTQAAIAIKALIEQIREQIQNLA